MRSVVAPPLDVRLDRDERVALLPRRPHRSDHAVREPGRARVVGERLDHPARELPSLLARRHADRDRHERRVWPVGRHPAHEPLVPARRQVLERPVPRQRDRVGLGEEIVAVDERDLEVGKVRVQPAPVEVARLVLVHVLGEGRLGQLLEATLQQLRPVGVADDLHRCSSATACAARPSPRPVKPRRSVVVARTLTRPTSTPSAPASRSHISSRRPRRSAAPRRRGRSRRSRAPSPPRAPRGRPLQRRSSEDAPRYCSSSGREERADVAEVRGAEDRVDERVRDDVAVGVAGQTARILDRHAAEHERHALLERVRVVRRSRPGARSRERG